MLSNYWITYGVMHAHAQSIKNIIFMFMIIIHVFQMDINCILMKYYFNVFNHNSWHFMDIICILMKYYLMFMIIIQVFQKYCICILINETLFSCL